MAHGRSSCVPIGQPSFYSRSEMDRLLQKAVDRMEGAGSAKVEWLYRNKPPEYFRDIEENQDGVMRAVMKDNGGDPRCPINNKIEGLYFLASVEPSTGQPIPNSPFGSTRLLVPPGEYGKGIMLDRNANLYFADFFCLQGDTHYVTLVVTPNRWCDEDEFCKQHLVPLHWINNPFLFKKEGVPHVGTAPNTLIEVFCTSSLNLRMIRNSGAKIEENIPTFGRGGARGLQKNPYCRTCNI